MGRIRGRDIGMVFQETMTLLNPVLTVGRQITETLGQHQVADRAPAERRALELFFLEGEDGIRGELVTGVQTCALPIWFSYSGIRGCAFVDAWKAWDGRCFRTTAQASRACRGSSRRSTGCALRSVSPCE